MSDNLFRRIYRAAEARGYYQIHQIPDRCDHYHDEIERLRQDVPPALLPLADQMEWDGHRLGTDTALRSGPPA